MQEDLDYQCPDHPNPADCPDHLIAYHERDKTYGLWVHDGGRSFIQINYCPWCGTDLRQA